MSDTFVPGRFGRYTLVDKLAVGGMAEVFRAKSYGEGGVERLVVLKRILPGLLEQPSFQAFFLSEARLSMLLEHPNVVRVYDFDEAEGRHFLAMEHVSGPDLRHLLTVLARTHETIPRPLVLFIMREVARGLAYAHQLKGSDGRHLGIVHRDVSPSNVFLAYDGRVKIGDFGIATGHEEPTQGWILGKLSYISPEQAAGKTVDARADLFSFGAVLYELLTGRKAFQAEDKAAQLRLSREGRYTPAERLVPDLPAELALLLRRLLSPDPDDRPQHAGEVEAALTAMLPLEEDAVRQDRLSRYLRNVLGPQVEADLQRIRAANEIGRQVREDELRHEQTAEMTRRKKARKALWAAIGAGLVLAVGLGIGISSAIRHAQQPGVVDLVVEVNPAAAIFLDGKLRGTAELLTIPGVVEGTHELRLSAEGYALHDEDWTFDEENHQVQVELQPLPPATVDITSTPDGAQVFVDGKAEGAAPLKLELKVPFTGTLQVKAEGHVTHEETLELSEGGVRVERAITLRKPARRISRSSAGTSSKAAAASGQGSLGVVLAGASWADVYVDGRKQQAKAPFANLQLSAGSHEVRVVNEALGLDHTQTVTVAAGQKAVVRARAM